MDITDANINQQLAAIELQHEARARREAEAERIEGILRDTLKYDDCSEPVSHDEIAQAIIESDMFKEVLCREYLAGTLPQSIIVFFDDINYKLANELAGIE